MTVVNLPTSPDAVPPSSMPAWTQFTPGKIPRERNAVERDGHERSPPLAEEPHWPRIFPGL